MRPSSMTEQNEPGFEQTPGVYTRQGQSPQEIDMLWSSTQQYHKEERAPVVFVLVGIVIGAVITGLVLTLLLKKPEIKTGPDNVAQEQIDENDLLPGAENKAAQSAPAAKAENKPGIGFNLLPEAPKPATAPVNTTAVKKLSATKSYTVKNGDTLERIARKVYGSGSPENVARIQRANQLSSPDRIRIDQKLVIPPANY
ncbi:MAG: LysM peptidoglycan-binding domain-containing protein [Candidatus Melainabacteria bacterium]